MNSEKTVCTVSLQRVCMSSQCFIFSWWLFVRSPEQ